MTQELRRLIDVVQREAENDGYKDRPESSNTEEAKAMLMDAILALLARVEKSEKALKVAANALSLALSDIDWRKDSPTQPVIHKAYQKAMEASK